MLSDVILLRFFTILAVVLGHSSILYVDSWSVFNPLVDSAFFATLRAYINVFQMPLFIFISGYIYYFNRVEKDKYHQFLPFVKNKFYRLLIPFLTVAVLYVLPIRLHINYAPYQGESLPGLFLKHVVLGIDIGHLWYVQALFNIFVLFHLIEKPLRKLPSWQRLVILFGLNVISVFIPNVFNLTATIRYLLYFYLGYSVRGKAIKAPEKFNALPLLAFFVLHLSGLLYSALTQGSGGLLIEGIGFVVGSIGSVFSCLFYYSLFNKISAEHPTLHTNRFIHFIDSKSYGIYLFHSPIMYLVLYYFSSLLAANPIFTVATLFLAMLMGSLAITLLIEKTKLFNFMLGKPLTKSNKKNTTA